MLYRYENKDNTYHFFRNDSPLLTPNGSPVKTKSPVLADRLQKHLEEYGESPNNVKSIVAFVYPLIDFFSQIPADIIKEQLLSGYDRYSDWTFNCPTANPGILMEWVAFFGSQDQFEGCKKWIMNLNSRELCAAYVLNAAIGSLNIPYILATNDLDQKGLKTFAKKVNEFFPYTGGVDLNKYFDNFKFFYFLEKHEQQ